MKKLLLLPFFALLMLMSCQQEVVDVTAPAEAEALVASSTLTSLVASTSIKDGSADNIIDKANCLSVDLPVTVVVNGVEIIIDSKEDFAVIEAIFNEFDHDNDNLEIIFPIKIILSDYTEMVINNRQELIELAQQCNGENEQDDDIECIDFQYPISFSIYNTQFQVIDVVTIENDAQLHRFIRRVRQGEVFASINFPVTMVLADGTTIVVNNNQELQSTIEEAKDACNEDDNNDYHDDDFTKERLDALLMTCPWVVYEMERNQDNLNDFYREYVMVFKADNVVKVHSRNGDLLTGRWTTRVTDRGALIKLEFDTLVDFALEWFVYDLEPGRIKLYQEGGNRIILKKNCDIVVDITKERIESYLQECFWRVARLNINGTDNEGDYIGTPLKFFPNNIVKIRVNGELVEGTYEIGVRNAGFILQINLEGRPNLQLEWLVTFLQSGLIKLQSSNSQMVLERHCPDGDGDLFDIDQILNSGIWNVALYQEGDVNKTENYYLYNIDFLENGWVKVTDPNNGIIDGSWLSFRNNGLFLGLNFGLEPPFEVLNHRWKIVSVKETRIELKDLSNTGTVERILVLERQ
ncbi:hypothetical protein V8G56_14660 [Gaetbulibacter aquiaggeris]|uniref:Lipoprotein n=1 Tax=Gaetbulibacter aquiaggeris TaxID=1735373 RepID=A0ABW7MT00_9FLAO